MRTPAPPPFASMNSTPPASKARPDRQLSSFATTYSTLAYLQTVPDFAGARCSTYTATASNPGVKCNPVVFSSLTTATKPALEWGSRRRDVRLAKMHDRIGGATFTLGHLHVRDYRKDDRRKRRDRNKSEPLHRGTAAAARDRRTFRQLATSHIRSSLAELKIGAAVLRVATREVRLDAPLASLGRAHQDITRPRPRRKL